ncbi:MAG: MFS transporter [Candidatus Omnitrophica bacterium]|nr:MFS transporter [Candidatus Omnitrophota bacterium]
MKFENKGKIGDEEKLRGLPWSIAGNAFNNVFCLFTVFGSVFLLFLTELGLSKQLIGFLLSLFPFCGIIAPFLSGYMEYFGVKRIFLFCFGLRKAVIALFLLLPWVIGFYGERAGVYFLITAISVFAVLRAIAETAYYAWMKEYIPDNARGKYSALNWTAAGIAGLIAIYFASRILKREGGIEDYMLLIGAGCIFGIIGVYFMRFIPGGKPSGSRKRPTLSFDGIIEPLKDRNFLYFLVAVGIAIFGSLLLVFLPLFAKEKLGILSGNVVLLDNFTILGSLLLCFLWGWMSDRFGGRPILMLNMCIYAGVSLGWLVFPRGHSHSVLLLAALYFISGSTLTGRVVGDNRFLYSSIVPEEGAVYYTSLFYAWMGLAGGIAPLAAGYILKKFAELNIRFAGHTIDSYSVIFFINFLCQLTAIFFYRKVKPDKRIKTRHLLLRMARRSMNW